MRLFSFPKVVRSWRKLFQTEHISSEYRQWRHRFILKRLRLIIWVTIVVWLVNILVNLIMVVHSSNQYDFYQRNYLLLWSTATIEWNIATTELLQFLLALLLIKIALVRQYPLLIFLWLISTLCLTQQIFYTIFLTQIELATNTWGIAFPIIAILLPVKWKWYLLAQAIVLGQFAISYFMFGLREASIEYGLEYFTPIYIALIVFSIVNIGVLLYERLLQQEFELKRQLRLFSHTVSHDLRNPVLGNMFLLKSLHNTKAKETTISNEVLEQIIDSGDRQLRLIDTLLEAHNTETKGIVLRLRPTSINNLVQSVVIDMQPFFDRDRTVVIKNLPAKLPLVNIDPLQIRRVYENIIANALEHNRSGLHLTLQVEQNRSKSDRQNTAENRWIYCTVSDDGEGIPPHLHSQLFSLYTRTASNKQSLNIGLGLYICWQIITAHGGEIGVNNTQKGASFWFTLPIVI